MASEQGCEKVQWLQAAIQCHEARLLRFAARIIGDADRARDIVQDTFVRLARHEPAALDGHLTQWLYTVCRRRALDVLRKEGRVRSLESGRFASEGVASAPVDLVEQREEVGRLLTALAVLPEKQQEAVRLKFQHGLSYRQIAGVMKLSVSHVGVLLHSALRSVRRQLAEQEEDDGNRSG